MKKLLCFLALIPLLTLAQIPEPMPNTYVNDFANVLTKDQIQNLNERIRLIETKSSVQFAIVLIQKLPNVTIADYSIELGRKWHVGNARNGLVYVIAISDRKQDLSVASALEGTITDADALELTETTKPFFRNGDYFGGLNELITGVENQLEPALVTQKQLGNEEKIKKEDQKSNTSLYVFLSLLILISGWYVYWIIKKTKQQKLDEEKEAALRHQASIQRQNEFREYEKRVSAQKQEHDEFRQTRLLTPLIVANNLIGKTTTTKKVKKPIKKNKETNNKLIQAATIAAALASTQESNYTPPQESRRDDESSSNFGNWGSDSSSSSDTSFSGGGASNDW